jgi:hypothetical protein
MAYSEMLRRVVLVRTDVSEELSASFIRVTRMGVLGTTVAVTNNRRTLRRNTKYVSEERSASFIRVTRIGVLGTTLTVTSNRRTLRRNTKYFSEELSASFKYFFAACVGC